MLQVILEYPRLKDQKKGIPLQVQDDLPIEVFVSELVERLQLPTSDLAGRPVTYRLSTSADGRPLPGHQCFLDVVSPGTQVRLEADVAACPTLPTAVPTRRDGPLRDPGLPRMNRRAVLTTSTLLITVSLTGLLTGATTALAQRALSRSPHRMAVSPAPSVMATPSRLSVQPQFRFRAHRAPVRTVAWSPDGTLLASGGDDATLLLWTPAGNVRTHLWQPESVHALAWSPGGKRVALSTGANVVFVDASTGEVLGEPQQVHQNAITSLTWSAFPGHPVVSGSLDTRAVVWGTERYLPQRVFTRHTAPIEAVSSAAGGEATIASASQGSLTRVWHLDTLQEVHGFYQDATVAMHAVAFSSKGNQLAVGGHDGVVRVWENGQVCQRSVTTSNELQCADAPQRFLGDTAPVRAVAWSSDGSYLATGGDDQQVTLWEAMAGFSRVATIAHDAPVHAISWSPNRQFLAVAAGNVIQIWKLA